MKNLQLIVILKLKSFHSYYLNKYVFLLWKKLKASIPVFEHQIFLPVKIERFTVLKSPHVDKKARDQFERRIYTRILYWKIPYNGNFQEVSMLFLKIFRNFSSLVIGIEFKVSYILTRSNKTLNSNKLKKTKHFLSLYNQWLIKKN